MSKKDTQYPHRYDISSYDDQEALLSRLRLDDFLSNIEKEIDRLASRASAEDGLLIIKRAILVARQIFAHEHFDNSPRNPVLKNTGTVDELSNEHMVKVYTQRAFKPADKEVTDLLDDLYRSFSEFESSSFSVNSFHESFCGKVGQSSLLTEQVKSSAQRKRIMKRNAQFHASIRLAASKKKKSAQQKNTRRKKNL